MSNLPTTQRNRPDDVMTNPPINKDNIDTWNMIVYCWILNGMMKEDQELKYGEAMTKANKITNFLFKALGKTLK